MGDLQLRLVATALAFIVGCSTSPSGMDASDGGDAADAIDAPNASDASDAPAPQPTHVRFSLADGGTPIPLAVPFPTDLYRNADGTIASTLSDWHLVGVTASTDTFQQGFAALDGFGLVTGAMFSIVGGGIDPATLPVDTTATTQPGASVGIVDLGANAAAPFVRAHAGYDGNERVLDVQPDGVVLEPAHTYAVFVTDAIHATDGQPLQADSDFVAIRDGGAAARATTAGALYGSALDRIAALEGAGFDVHHVVGLAVFTTQTTPRQLRAMHSAVMAGTYGPAPTLNTEPATSAPFHVVRFGAHTHTGWDATLDEYLGIAPQVGGMDLPGLEGGPTGLMSPVGHDAIGVVLNATFVAPEYRRPYMGTASAADDTFAFDPSGALQVQNPNNVLPITIILPETPPPVNGYPVVFVGHGIFGQRGNVLLVANELARAGLATVAIDVAFHGQRLPDHVTDTQSLYNGTYAGPDGFADLEALAEPGPFMGNFVNMLAIRDNLRQTVLDWLQVIRLVRNPSLDLGAVADEYGGVVPRLDGTHIAYLGISLGSGYGTVLTSIAPEINPVVLDVGPGALLVGVLADSPVLNGPIGLLLRPPYHVSTSAPLWRHAPLLNLGQALLDGADSLPYAADVTHPATGAGSDVLFFQADSDETIGTRAPDSLARALGLAQLEPFAHPIDGLASVNGPVVTANDMGHTRVLVQLEPSAHADISFRHAARSYEPGFPHDDQPIRFTPLPSRIFIRSYAVYEQRAAAQFIASAWAPGAAAPTIDATHLAPVPDFDDDTFCDADERTAGTNPYDPTSHPTGTGACIRDVGY